MSISGTAATSIGTASFFQAACGSLAVASSATTPPTA